MTPPRAPSHVDRGELPEGQRLTLIERDVQELRQDVADIMAGEARRDDRLKTDTQSSISSAAVMMTAQGAMLSKHDRMLEELVDTSRESAKEREKRVERDKEAAEEKAEEMRKERRKFWLALTALLVPIVTTALYLMAHATPPAPEGVHETPEESHAHAH